MRETIRAGALAILVGLAGAACTTTRAAAPVDRPALEVPPPPPRVVVPIPPPPPQLEPVQELGTVTSPIPKPRPPQREPATSKPDPKPEEPKPVEQPPVAPPVQQPATPQLRLPENSNSPQASQIQAVIKNSKDILNTVTYQNLSPTARKAYNESKLLAEQADNALKANNLALAKELADKAERLAKELQGRYQQP